MANALGYVTETKTGFEGSLAMMNLTRTRSTGPVRRCLQSGGRGALPGRKFPAHGGSRLPTTSHEKLVPLWYLCIFSAEF